MSKPLYEFTAHWSHDQTKKMEQSGFFERARAISFWGRTYYIRESDYKALRTMILTLMAAMTLTGTLIAAWVIRP